MALSPLDLLHYAMAATRASSHVVCGEPEAAAAGAERAARAPGAHVLIAVIAAAADFFRSFPFADPEVRQRADSSRMAGILAGRRGSVNAATLGHGRATAAAARPLLARDRSIRRRVRTASW